MRLRPLPFLERAGADSLLSETFRTVARSGAGRLSRLDGGGAQCAGYLGQHAAAMADVVDRRTDWPCCLWRRCWARRLRCSNSTRSPVSVFCRLLLTGLGPIPCLGTVAVLAALCLGRRGVCVRRAVGDAVELGYVAVGDDCAWGDAGALVCRGGDCYGGGGGGTGIVAGMVGLRQRSCAVQASRASVALHDLARGLAGDGVAFV